MNRLSDVLRGLEQAGWSVAEADLPSDGWWARDIWHLRSRWSPQGAACYLSALLDPMGVTSRNTDADHHVWAVGLSRDMPRTRADAEQVLVPLTGPMPDVVAKVVARAADLRVADESSGF